MSDIVTTTQSNPLCPQNYNELIDFAGRAANTNMVPKDYQGRPENIVLAVQMGAELGLAPMQSLQNIAVIGGRPAVWGDAMLGLCRRSALCQDVVETLEGEGDAMEAVCIATRVGAKPVEQRFSVADAKKANLWGKAGPWQQYPARMLQQRARGFALRDAFPDILKGLISSEEARDIPFEGNLLVPGKTIEGKAEAPHAPGHLTQGSPPPLRAAAAPTPRAQRKTEAEKAGPTARTDEQWRVWVDKLQAACSVLYRRSDVVEIAERPSVSDAIATGPAWVQREVSAILAENYRRFPEEPDAETPDDGELEIAGADKLAAG